MKKILFSLLLVLAISLPFSSNNLNGMEHDHDNCFNFVPDEIFLEILNQLLEQIISDISYEDLDELFKETINCDFTNQTTLKKLLRIIESNLKKITPTSKIFYQIIQDKKLYPIINNPKKMMQIFSKLKDKFIDFFEDVDTLQNQKRIFAIYILTLEIITHILFEKGKNKEYKLNQFQESNGLGYLISLIKDFENLAPQTSKDLALMAISKCRLPRNNKITTYFCLDLIKLLMANGANPYTEDENGKTAINYSYQEPQITEILMKYNADYNTLEYIIPAIFLGFNCLFIYWCYYFYIIFFHKYLSSDLFPDLTDMSISLSTLFTMPAIYCLAKHQQKKMVYKCKKDNLPYLFRKNLVISILFGVFVFGIINSIISFNTNILS